MRVLDCGASSNTSTVLAGLDWIANDFRRATSAAATAAAQGPVPLSAAAPPQAVLVMSLGVPAGTWSDAMRAAVASLATQMTVVVAAGNAKVKVESID